MPDELVGEALFGLLRGIFRCIFEILFEFIGELLVKGAGYLLCRPFKPDINPDSWLVSIAGLVFWAAVVLGVYALL